MAEIEYIPPLPRMRGLYLSSEVKEWLEAAFPELEKEAELEFWLMKTDDIQCNHCYVWNGKQFLEEVINNDDAYEGNLLGDRNLTIKVVETMKEHLGERFYLFYAY